MELFPLQSQFNDWDMILFATYYHDIVYSVTAKNNEEKSAVLAKKRLMKLSIPTAKIDFCFEAIVSTKTHEIHSSQDINHFTDADLAILGSSNENYQKYLTN